MLKHWNYLARNLPKHPIASVSRRVFVELVAVKEISLSLGRNLSCVTRLFYDIFTVKHGVDYHVIEFDAIPTNV